MVGPIAKLAAGYLAGKAKDMIENKAGLPSGTLGKVQNPVNILTGELKNRMLDTARGVVSGSIKPGGKVGKSGEQMPDTEEDTEEDTKDYTTTAYKKGGAVRKIDGCAQRGKTKGKIV